MKSFTRFFLGVLVFIGASCTDIQPDNEKEAVNGVRFTAKIRSEVSTKAVSDCGISIIVEWKSGEKIALIYKVGDKSYNTSATVTAVDGSNNATISAVLQTGVTDGTAVTLIYPASAADGTTGNILSTVLTEQDGILSAARDVRKGTGTLSVDESSASFSSSPVLKAEYAICKFTVQDLGGSSLSVSSLIVRDGWDEIITTVMPTTPTSTLYVSLPKSSGIISWFSATAEGKPYLAKGTSNLEAGAFYTPTMKMATVGNVIASDGKFYVNANAAEDAGKNFSAMIAYLGTVNEVCKHGLALTLNDEYTYQTDYSGAQFGVSQITYDHPIAGATWRLPTVADWQYMVSGKATTDYFEDISSIQTALGNAGGDALAEGYHWTGTEIGDKANVFYYQGPAASLSYRFSKEKDAQYAHVRPCLTF